MDKKFKKSSAAWFASPGVRNIFCIYLLGFLLLTAALCFVVFSYQHLQRQTQSAEQLADRSVTLIAAAERLPRAERAAIVKGVVRQGLRVSLQHNPAIDASLINAGDLQQVRQLIMQNPEKFGFSIQVQAGTWLTIRHHAAEKSLLLDSFILLSLLLMLAMAGLLFSLVRRLAYPLDGFVQAAQRFARDVQASPIALQGPAELQQLAQSFNRMQAKVQRLIEDRTQMLAAISHDLRTPITRLQLRVESLAEDKREKALQDLHEMEQMIDSILSFARLEHEHEAVTHFDLNALLVTLCDEQADAGHHVHYKTQTRTPYVGKVLALKRALHNMLQNAFKYGGSAEVSLQVQQAYIVITICDSGPGIAESQLEKVFRPFYRLDKARTSGAGGSGLGLAVARDIVRAHAGDIHLSNLPQGGLQVEISLPRHNS